MALAKFAEEIYLMNDERLYSLIREKGGERITYYDKFCCRNEQKELGEERRSPKKQEGISTTFVEI